MTSRLLQTALSPVVTRGSRNFSKRLLSEFNFTGIFPHSEKSRKWKTMPIIQAVAAHRHHHNVTEQIQIPIKSCQFVHPYCSHEISNRSLNHDNIVVATLLQPQRRQLSTTWLKTKNKSTSGKSALSFNCFGTSPVHEFGNGSRRSYSKGKDRGEKKKSVVVINEDEMNEVINVASLKAQYDRVLAQMKAEYASQLSIRGASGVLELLQVEFDGEKYPLQELAQIGRKNPQLVVLNLASLPDACQPVMKAIQESGMQLNPQQEGTTIYVPLPKVTREHRENLAKNAKTIFTKQKTAFHEVQNRFVKQCKSHKDFSEDTVFSITQQIMKMAENYITEAEHVMREKQKELLGSGS